MRATRLIISGDARPLMDPCVLPRRETRCAEFVPTLINRPQTSNLPLMPPNFLNQREWKEKFREANRRRITTKVVLLHRRRTRYPGVCWETDRGELCSRDEKGCRSSAAFGFLILWKYTCEHWLTVIVITAHILLYTSACPRYPCKFIGCALKCRVIYCLFVLFHEKLQCSGKSPWILSFELSSPPTRTLAFYILCRVLFSPLWFSSHKNSKYKPGYSLFSISFLPLRLSLKTPGNESIHQIKDVNTWRSRRRTGAGNFFSHFHSVFL